jgi:hypothetical protein
MISKMPPMIAALLFLTGTTVVTGGVMTYNAGAVKVSVDENRPGGDHVHLFVPAVMVSPALRLIPEEELRKHAREIQPWLPAIKIASRELAKCPDGILVEVIDTDEHVTITKQGGALVVDVKSADENVHVAVPLQMIHSVAERLESSGPPV